MWISLDEAPLRPWLHEEPGLSISRYGHYDHNGRRWMFVAWIRWQGDTGISWVMYNHGQIAREEMKGVFKCTSNTHLKGTWNRLKRDPIPFIARAILEQ